MDLIFKIFLWLGLGLGLTSFIQCQSLRGANLIVSTVLDPPFISLRDDSSTNITGNDRFEGFIVDIIEEASKIYEFNYVLKLNEHGYGFKNQYGKWQGTIGDIVNGWGHIAAGPIDITHEREVVVDFTYPFMNAGIGIIFKKSEVQPPGILDHGLFHPFKSYTTDAFLLVVIILGIALILLHRKHKSYWFRIILGLWLVLLFVFASLFIAQLSAFHVGSLYGLHDMRPMRFTKVEEIASQSRVKYGLVEGGSTEAFFRNSNISIYSKMWSQMKSSDPSPFVKNTVEGIERVKKGEYAFLTESPLIEYVTQRECDLYQIGSLLNSKGFGLAVQQGSSIRESLNMAILELQERGTLLALKNKWWTEKKGGGACTLND